MMKDRTEWMPELQEINWTKVEVEQSYPGEEVNLFGVIRSVYNFFMLKSDSKVLKKDDLDSAIKFEG